MILYSSEIQNLNDQPHQARAINQMMPILIFQSKPQFESKRGSERFDSEENLGKISAQTSDVTGRTDSSVIHNLCN